jgi:hypothetical protein
MDAAQPPADVAGRLEGAVADLLRSSADERRAHGKKGTT